VLLPISCKTQGGVLADQIRTLHHDGRSFRFIERVPPEVLFKIRAIIRELIGIRL
jgi:mRNA-degrading endonuclease toxin of MazEF toxin-antitoxin module